VTLQPKGLLIEEQRTNMGLYSAQFDDVTWNKNDTTITANTTVAPDGSVTADTSTEAATTAVHTTTQAFTVSAVSHTFSVYLKKGNGATAPDWMQLSFGGTSTAHANFNLSTGTVGASSGGTPSITFAGNGWYRCSVTVTPTAGSMTTQIVFTDNADSGRRPSYAGQITSNVFIWGAQLEAGAFATSYIPTVASQVTRAVDSASMLGNNFARWYNVNTGTFYAQSVSFGDASVRYITFASDATNSNRIAQYFGTSSMLGLVTTGGTSQASMSIGGVTPAKTALAYATDNFAFARNATLATDSAGTAPVGLTQMQIGAGLTAATSPLNGTIARIAYYNRRLADSELQGITS
jgi:hypothetical protein